MLPRIRIITFGPLQIVRGDYAVTERDWHTRQARQLLKILLTERPRPVAADRLIEMLWPESAPAAAATTLRSAVNALRNVLEPDRPHRAPSRYVLTRVPGYAFELHPDIWLDVEVFERELEISRTVTSTAERIAHLQVALDLYQDDYLSPDRYADWATAERERLQELYFGALLQRAELDAQSGNLTGALAAVRAVLARDPVRETAYQALMRYQAQSGDSAGALLTYERCRSLLADELGADPNPLTRRLHEAILSGEISLQHRLTSTVSTWFGAGMTPPPDLPPVVQLPNRDPRGLPTFVGRQNVLAKLRQAVTQFDEGSGGLIFVTGEAGSGKSRLLHHFVQSTAAAQSPLTILCTACHALGQSLPFAPVADLISGCLAALPDYALAALPAATLSELSYLVPQILDRLPGLPPAPALPLLDAATKRLRIVESCTAFFLTLARAHPCLLVLDDLHWADADTLSVLQFLADRAPQARLLIIGTLRTDDLADNRALESFLVDHGRIDDKAFVPLASLTRSETDTLLNAALPPRQRLDEGQIGAALYTVTQGNALFVTEALLDLRETLLAAPKQEEHSFGVSETAAMLEQNPHVQAIVQSRAQRLPPAALSVLQVAASIGREFGGDLLETAAAIDPAPWLDLLLQRRFLVALPNGQFDFAHELVRRVILAATNPLQRRRNHLAVAVGLEALGRATQTPVEVAQHYAHAGESHARSFIHYSILAGEALVHALGFDQAVSHFTAALNTMDSDSDFPPEAMRRALVGLGLAYEGMVDAAGLTATYQRLALWAEANGDRTLLVVTHSRMVALLAMLGHQSASRHALQHLASALAVVHGRGLQVLHDLVARRHLIYTPDTSPANGGWTQFTDPAPPLRGAQHNVLALMPPAQATLPLLDYGQMLLMQGYGDEAVEIFDTVVDLAKEVDQPLVLSLALHQLGVAARTLGDLGKAYRYSEEALHAAQALPSATGRLATIMPHVTLAALALEQGQVDEAETQALAMQTILEHHPVCYNYRHSSNILLGLVALERGDFMQAQARLETAVADPFNVYPYTYVHGLLGLARIAYLYGQFDRSSSFLRRALHFAGRRSLLAEYVAALHTTTQLHPHRAPLLQLLESAQRFCIANELIYPGQLLDDATRRATATARSPVPG